MEGFDDFAHDKSFKKLPALGSVLNGFRRQPFGQVGHQAGVQHIDFRGFDGAFEVVVAIGLQQIDDARCLQHGEPTLDGIHRYADFLGHAAIIQ